MSCSSSVHETADSAGFCRSCGELAPSTARRCPACHSPRLLHHPELHALSIAHLDCDAFYAAVEKRDNPELKDKPVIIGGGTRGVVSTCCYIARIEGVRSAMPMWKALSLCPEAVVIRPDMAKYSKVGRQVRERMLALTPLVEPLSIDEAFMDLTGTARLHGLSPARALARLAREIETHVGITVSIGLSHNKFLAKLASDMDKPRGFSVIGEAETLPLLAGLKVGAIWGVGKAMRAQLEAHGIGTVAQLQKMDKSDLMRRFGQMGLRLYHLSRGEDSRTVIPDSDAKSIGAETTFDSDIHDPAELEKILWAMTQKVSRRAKADGVGGTTLTLKLKTPDFKSRTRSASLNAPTSLAWRMFQAMSPVLKREATGAAFRLLGVSLTNLKPMDPDDEQAGLDPDYTRHAKAEHAMDVLRAKFGPNAVGPGRGLGQSLDEEDEEDDDEA
jgi:DNA polymerase-4